MTATLAVNELKTKIRMSNPNETVRCLRNEDATVTSKLQYIEL